MTTDTAFAMVDVTDPETPIWNEVFGEWRERLITAGILYTPPSDAEQQPADVVALAEPEPALDAVSPVAARVKRKARPKPAEVSADAPAGT